MSEWYLGTVKENERVGKRVSESDDGRSQMRYVHFLAEERGDERGSERNGSE